MIENRIFVKDCLDIQSAAKTEAVVKRFDLDRDILQSSSSTIELAEMPKEIEMGDFVGLIDQYGSIIYQGIVDKIETNSLQISQIESIFKDEWLYRVPNTEYIEDAIYDVIVNDFKNSSDPRLSARFNFDVIVETHTKGKFPVQDPNYTISFEQMLYTLYTQYNVRLYFDINFTAGVPTITIANRDYPFVKIGNNTRSIINISPTKDVKELNKLVIYNSDGTQIRAIYYGSENGITTNANDPTRLPVVKTAYEFNDDEELGLIVGRYLTTEMYNHYLSFQFVVDNELYDFNDMHLSQPIKLWNNEDYYESVYTGFRMTKEENKKIEYIQIKCGKVRVELTSKMKKGE